MARKYGKDEAGGWAWYSPTKGLQPWSVRTRDELLDIKSMSHREFIARLLACDHDYRPVRVHLQRLRRQHGRIG